MGTACPRVRVTSRVPTGTHREGREKCIHVVLGHPGGTERGVREGHGHGHPPLSPSTAGRDEGTTQPGDIGVLPHEQHQLLDVDEDGAAREAAEEDDDGGTLQDHPHPQQVLAAIGLQGERAAVKSAGC